LSRHSIVRCYTVKTREKRYIAADVRCIAFWAGREGAIMKFMRSVIGFAALTICSSSWIFAQNAFSYEDQQMVKAFEKRANEYAKLRTKVEGSLPKLSKTAASEEIIAHKLALQNAIQKQRANARVGEIFTPESAVLIRRMIKTEFKGWEGSEIRKTVLDAETKGVPVKVNLPYPDSAELIEMSPSLLLSLPQLPSPLRYRFIGRNLVIMDRDNALIIDYMTNALP
jgi:hypothetical protein